jgi:hypothetical protein
MRQTSGGHLCGQTNSVYRTDIMLHFLVKEIYADDEDHTP